MRPSNKKWTWAAGFDLLMQESESLIHYASDAGSEALRAVTKPVIEDGKQYQLWERQHSTLMRLVADVQNLPLQVFRLRQIIMSTVHRTALVDAVTRHRIEDESKSIIVTHFHPSREYDDAWLCELHGYRRIESSSICARYFAIKLGDPMLQNWLQIYKRAYDEYFEDYCQMILAERSGRGDLWLWREVVGESKSDLIAKHRAILGNTSTFNPRFVQRETQEIKFTGIRTSSRVA